MAHPLRRTLRAGQQGASWHGTGERGAAGRDSPEPTDPAFAGAEVEALESDDQPEEQFEALEDSSDEDVDVDRQRRPYR